MQSRVIQKALVILGLVIALAFLLASPVQAFESRGGDRVVIEAGEVVEDDLYVGANSFILRGTVRGDVIAAGANILIDSTGVVEGDLMAAGQSVTVNGQVTDDARLAGAALSIGEGAEIADDLVAAGYSLEIEPGGQVGGEVTCAGSQALLAGAIAGDVLAAVGGLEIQGTIQGNVNAEVGSGADTLAVSPFRFMSNAPDVPTVQGGLTVGEGAEIGGDLEYGSPVEYAIPAGVVAGQVRFDQEAVDRDAPTAVGAVLDWFLDNLRTLVTLLLVGLLMVWLFPRFTRASAATLDARPLASFGWGIVSVFALFFALFVLFVLVLILAVVLGVITLGDLMGATIWTGLLVAFALVLGFSLAAGYLSKVIVSYLGGRLILGRLNPAWAESRVWPVVVGVLIFTLLAAIPFLGGLISLIVILFGLGAIWLLAWGRLQPSTISPT